MNSTKFFRELKRRNVYKVAIAYAVAGWLVIQVATQVFPFLEIPNWMVRLVIALVVLGFPIAAISAWAFEVTSQGIKRTEQADALPGSEHWRAHAWIYVVLICSAVSAALFCLGRYTTEGKTQTPGDIANKSIAVLPFEKRFTDVHSLRYCPVRGSHGAIRFLSNTSRTKFSRVFLKWAPKLCATSDGNTFTTLTSTGWMSFTI